MEEIVMENFYTELYSNQGGQEDGIDENALLTMKVPNLA